MEFDNLGIRTKSELQAFLDNLNKCRSASDINKLFNQEKALVLTSFLSSKNLEELKSDIKSYFYAYKDIVIYTSFEPSADFVTTTSDLFSNDKKSLLDFKVSEEIIAGVKIAKDGKMYDESYLSRLNSLLK